MPAPADPTDDLEEVPVSPVQAASRQPMSTAEPSAGSGSDSTLQPAVLSLQSASRPRAGSAAATVSVIGSYQHAALQPALLSLTSAARLEADSAVVTAAAAAAASSSYQHAAQGLVNPTSVPPSSPPQQIRIPSMNVQPAIDPAHMPFTGMTSPPAAPLAPAVHAQQPTGIQPWCWTSCC